MRRQISGWPYVGLGAILFCWVNLSISSVDWMRETTVAALSPAWRLGKSVQKYVADRPIGLGRPQENREEILRLQCENQMLKAQIEKMSQWLENETRLKEQGEIFAKLGQEIGIAFLKEQMRKEFLAVPAQVIYRDPACWSSTIWINVGKKDHQRLGRPCIAKNSPVVWGDAVLGVVDYVGERQSRVRLITDSGLTPSVQTQRKGGARGELHGSSAPLWRSRYPVLKGIGFHFEGEGVALKQGDYLVTTGLDGVFPKGLKVGVVVSAQPMKRGDYVFELEARPAVEEMNDLDMVFVLPPLSE